MKVNNETFRSALEQMPTRQLDALLQEKLREQPVEENSVRTILSVLKEREAAYPIVDTAQIEAAWEHYQQQTKCDVPKKVHKRFGVLKAAAVLAVACVLFFAVPQMAKAEKLMDRLARWTDSIFAFINSDGETVSSVEYEFKTENPGLQEVYDIVTDLEVTDPVVPMWLLDYTELKEVKIVESREKTYVTATLLDRSSDAVLKIEQNNENAINSYQKDATNVTICEICCVTHIIMKNNDRWVVVWNTNQAECMLTIDCQEDELYEILRSIYTWEDE